MGPGIQKEEVKAPCSVSQAAVREPVHRQEKLQTIYHACHRQSYYSHFIASSNDETPYPSSDKELPLQLTETNTSVDADDCAIHHWVLDNGTCEASKLAWNAHAIRVDHMSFEDGVLDSVAHRRA